MSLLCLSDFCENALMRTIFPARVLNFRGGFPSSGAGCWASCHPKGLWCQVWVWSPNFQGRVHILEEVPPCLWARRSPPGKRAHLHGGVIIFVNRLPKRTPKVQSNGALYQGRHSNLRDRVPMFRGEAPIFRYRLPMLRISDPHL